MVSRMRNQPMFFQNLFRMLLLLAYITLVVGSLLTSGGAGDGDDATTTMMMRCRENERQALLHFKQALVDPDGVLSSWGTQQEQDCCNWRGIHCTNRTGHVIILELPAWSDDVTSFEGRLSGKVSSSLLELKHLKYLDLSHNDFQQSPIPEFVGSLSRLQHLKLRDAGFVGTIPHQLGNLTNLRSLDLGGNYGLSVKNLEWLSHLRLLRHLDLSNVDLENTIDWLQQIYKLSFLTQLHLFACGLPGSSRSPLLPLTNSSSIPLSILDLSYNNFNSPSSYNWLFNFSSSLVDIDMSGNPLRGSIPEAFGSMVSLEKLQLAYCELEGELPKSLKNLSRLKSLDLQGNSLTGQLSDFFRKLADIEMKSLEILNLCTNKLSGSLPDFTGFPGFPSLRELRLCYNELNGSFPERFGQISSIVILDFSHNKIPGTFPDLTLFPSLRELHLNNNQLEGTICETYLSNLSKLKILDLSFNSLALEFPSDWAPPLQPKIIRLAYCNLGTHFPKWLQSQNNFSELDISGAGISDSIPNWFWDLTPRLEYLNISYNQIQGVLPDLSRKFVDGAAIDLSSNHFKGPIPLLPPNASLLHLSNNMLTGSIFFLCTTTNKFLSSLDLSDNQLSGELPDCWMRMDQLMFLNLENNNFSGKIPPSIGFLHQLQTLQLRNNNFIGELPSSLKNCSNLELIDLSENKVSGEVPTWLGTHLTNLIVISLRKNEFSGSIPPHICYLSYAQVLDLSQNYISGNIPHCFDNLTSLLQSSSSNPFLTRFVLGYGSGFSYFDPKYLPNALVQWKGKDSEYRKNLGLLKFIDLSSNKLAGKIPQEFASLEGLISLNLSSNNLTGNIIQKIDHMKMLESLDLSRNHLSGEIPTSLASLTFLSVLDLSNNNFTGKIPSSTQLQGFNASVYAGNDKLCGLPLPSKCLEDEINLHPPPVGHGKEENSEEDEDRFVILGFYISVVFGFIVGFWGFFGPILLRSTWRHAYFRFLDKIKDLICVTTTINMARLQRKLDG